MNNPQNPYRSSVVKASAGSGKTYQLSRRFLFLVGAGAHPSSILTVTFTKKAAAEMRARILDMAANLLGKESEQENLEKALKEFWLDKKRENPHLLPPRSARETAASILASTQSLRISTIDSLLLDWTRKFPFEASGEGRLVIPPRFDLMGPGADDRVHSRSWFRTVSGYMQDERRQTLEKISLNQNLNLLDLENRLRELARHESFLWLVKQERAHLKTPLVLHPASDEWSESATEGELMEKLAPSLGVLVDILSPDRREAARQALAERDFSALKELRILTKEALVHGGTFRSPKRDLYAAQIEAIQTLSHEFFSAKAKARLNRVGSFLMDLFSDYENSVSLVKQEERSLSFSDLIKGGYHLFTHPDAAGARYLLNRTVRHLLLDEFQDTSVLQWTVFRTMADEMLSGQGYRSPDELDPTLFIVGDAKQSIYAFREADAEILDTAARFMIAHEALDIELSASYRTHPMLLKFINETMDPVMLGFPEHKPALAPGSEDPLIQGSASITIAPLFRASDGRIQPIEDEANFVAQTLEEKLNGETPVWDKETKSWRRLKASDCVILYRASTHARTYAAALRARGLSVRIEEGKSFFSRPEILDLLALCQLMAYPQDLQAACQVLKSPLVGVRDETLLEGLRAFRILAASDESLRDIDAVPHLFESLKDEIQSLLQTFERRHRSRPFEIIHGFAQDANWLQRYAEAFGEEEGLLAAANIQKFLELLLQADSSSHLSWMQVLRYLRERQREESISLASVSEDAVQMMTIHKAKGLEFPFVVLVGSGEEWEKADPYWAKLKDSPLGTGICYVGRRSDLPRNDAHFQMLEKNLSDEALRENYRLLYVALTRAQFHLLITGHQRKGKGEGGNFHEDMTRAALAMHAGKNPETLALEIVHEVPCEISEEDLPERENKEDPLEPLNWPNAKRPSSSIRILAPARLLADDEGQLGDPVGERLFPFPTEAGIYIHRALEADMRREDFDGPQFWRSLHKGQEAFLDAYGDVAGETKAILSHQSWISLKADAREAELPIAFLQRDMLVRGIIDLLVQEADGSWLVVDYKTTWEALGSEDLLSLCMKKRYNLQVGLYVEGVQRLYPDAEISGAIFFTAQKKLVRIPKSLMHV